jgi:hypothetical protein
MSSLAAIVRRPSKSSDRCRNRHRPTSRALTAGAPRSSGSGAPCTRSHRRKAERWSGTPGLPLAVEVGCYRAPRRGNAATFRGCGSRIEIAEIVDRWLASDHPYFKMRDAPTQRGWGSPAGCRGGVARGSGWRFSCARRRPCRHCSVGVLPPPTPASWVPRQARSADDGLRSAGRTIQSWRLHRR